MSTPTNLHLNSQFNQSQFNQSQFNQSLNLQQATLAQIENQSVIDRIPQTTTAVVTDQGGLFLIQVFYASIIIWVVSLLRGNQS